MHNLKFNIFIDSKFFLEYHMDSACQVNFKYDIVPIFYRTHAHNIIPVISGYFVKKDEDIMKELGTDLFSNYLKNL